MSKRRSRKERARQRRQIMIVGGVFTVIIVGGIVATLMLGPNRAQPAPQARLDLDPVWGNPDAPVTIVEYGAYSCHACQLLHESGVVERLVAESNGQVNFVFRDMPVIIPTYDHMAAEVAQCVLDQSQDAFWQFHDLLYTEYYANSTRDELVSIAATEAGANETELATCVEGLTHFHTVQYDLQRGRDLGIRGTPTLYVNGAPVFSPTEANLRSAIQSALASL